MFQRRNGQAPRSLSDLLQAQLRVQGTVREVLLPAHVSPERFDGPNRRYGDIFGKAHHVSCRVDYLKRKIILKGTADDVAFAENALWIGFYKYKCNDELQCGDYGEQRSIEVFVDEGSRFTWNLRRISHRRPDPEVCCRPYRLERSRRVDGADHAGRKVAWVNELDDRTAIMTPLSGQLAQTPTAYKIAFGEMCFAMNRGAWPSIDMRWSALQDQRLQIRWTNVCDLSISRLKRFVQSIEAHVDDKSERYDVMMVDVSSISHKLFCTLKYHVVNGEWRPYHKDHNKQMRCATNVMLDDGLWFRVRAACRDDRMANSTADVEDTVQPSIPAGSDIFAAGITVTDRRLYPDLVYHIAERSSKVEVEVKGLRFKIGYLDRKHTAVKLSCRLTPNEKARLSPGEDEPNVLMRRALQMLHEV